MTTPVAPEPGADSGDRQAPVEVIGEDAVRLHERWALLPRGFRATCLSAVAVLLIAAGVGYFLASRPEPPLMAQPLHSTKFTYVGIRDPEPHEKTFLADFTVLSETGAELEKITQGYEALALRSRPLLPLALPRDEATRLTVQFRVKRCAEVPLDAALPFLDVTVRNKRAIQVFSKIPGEEYAADLSRALRSLCGRHSGLLSPER
jgi:hypothetical protein